MLDRVRRGEAGTDVHELHGFLKPAARAPWGVERTALLVAGAPIFGYSLVDVFFRMVAAPRWCGEREALLAAGAEVFGYTLEAGRRQVEERALARLRSAS